MSDEKYLKGIANDPARYRRLSIPFQNIEVANEAMDGFMSELNELREKYKIPDIYCVMEANCLLGSEEGEEGSVIAVQHLGDFMKSERLAAYALGHEQMRRQKLIASILGGTNTRPTTK